MKLTVKIPLKSSKIKDKTLLNHKNRTSKIYNENNDILSNNLKEVSSKTKRKLEISDKDIPVNKRMNNIDFCNEINNIQSVVSSKEVKNKNIDNNLKDIKNNLKTHENEFEKLVVRISLSRLKRPPTMKNGAQTEKV